VAEVGELRGSISGGRLGAIAAVRPGHSPDSKSRDGYWRRAARAVPPTSGTFPFAAVLLLGLRTLQVVQLLGYTGTKKRKDRHTVPVYRVVRTWGKREHCPRHVVMKLQHFGQRVRDGLVPDVRHLRILLLALQAGAQFVQRVLYAVQPGVAPFLHRWHGLGRSSRLRGRRFLVIVLSMHQGMSAGPTLDFAQSDQVSPFKVSISVLKLPERRVRCSVMENIAHFFVLDWLGPRVLENTRWLTFVESIHVKLPHKRRDVGVLEVLAVRSGVSGRPEADAQLNTEHTLEPSKTRARAA